MEANQKQSTRNKCQWVVVGAIVLVVAAFVCYVIPHTLPYLASTRQRKQEIQPTVSNCKEKERVQIKTHNKFVFLTIQNMTTPSYRADIRQKLKKLAGVLDVKIALNPPRALVSYDPSIVDKATLVKAATNAGYPSCVLDKWECCGLVK